MNKEKYTNIELVVLNLFLFNSFTTTFIINSFKGFNTISIIISILTAFFLGTISLNMFFKLLNNNFLNNLNNNNFLKLIFKIIFIICAFFILLYSLYSSGAIMKEVLLPDGNRLVIEASLFLVASFLSLKGFKSLSIASNLFFYIVIFIIFISFSFSLQNIKAINLLPLSFSVNNLNFYEIFIFSISPIFMTLLIKKKQIDNFDKYKKYSYISYIIFIIYLLVKILFIYAILGDKYFSIMNYPEVEVLKMINIFNFFKNLEEFLIINAFIENLVVISLSISYITTIFNSIYNFNKKIYFILGIITFILLYNFEFTNFFVLKVILTIFVIFNFFTYKRRYKNE